MVKEVRRPDTVDVFTKIDWYRVEACGAGRSEPGFAIGESQCRLGQSGEAYC